MSKTQGDSFDYTPGHLSAIEAALSIERLAPYVAETQGDKAQALRRYEQNTRLSESLYGPLQAVEIVFRNAFNTQLLKNFGPQWFDVLDSKMLEFEQLQKIRLAREYLKKAGKQETAGRIVSELSFGFWTAICAKRYAASLWIPCLHKPFKGRHLSRNAVFDRLDSIRGLRNRVAHHEPILSRDLKADFAAIIEAIGWICGASSQWIEATSSFRSRFAQFQPE